MKPPVKLWTDLSSSTEQKCSAARCGRDLQSGCSSERVPRPPQGEGGVTKLNGAFEHVLSVSLPRFHWSSQPPAEDCEGRGAGMRVWEQRCDCSSISKSQAGFKRLWDAVAAHQESSYTCHKHIDIKFL